MKKLYPKTKMFEEAKAQSKGHNFIVEILILLLVFLVTEIVATLPYIAVSFAAMATDKNMTELVAQFNSGAITYDEYQAGVMEFENQPKFLLMQLFSTGITTLLVFVFCRFIEKRRLSTMGFRRDKFALEYVVGMLIGTAMFSAAVGICLITGSLQFNGVVSGIRWGLIALYFVGFLIQGMEEEVVCRGYFMVSVARRSPVALAVILSSVLFGCAHLANPEVSVLAIVNICLFGAFQAVYIIKRGNIWGACAIHSLWNFVQGNVYGINVSGLTKMDSIMEMTPVASKDLISGGLFGLEGGLGVTIVTVAAIIIVSLTKTKQSEIFDEENAPIVEPAITD